MNEGEQPGTVSGGPAGRKLSLSFVAALSAILALALVHRLAYVAAQPATDPTMTVPVLEGAYYLEWARSLVSGLGRPEGAFYLPPLFAYALTLFLRVAGETFWLLYAVQHMLVLGAALALALFAARQIGPREGLAAAALFLLYQPLLFFASRPLSEPLALFLLASSLLLAGSMRPAAAAAAGAVGALAALARPDLLPLPLLWAAAEVLLRRPLRGKLILAGAAAVLLPVALANQRASGHIVLVSANSGLTAYHGNGPGAEGIYMLPWGFSGEITRQRQEATALARALSRSDLDEVQADRWWGRQALRTRWGDPVDTARLLGRRLLLLIDSYEHAVDYHPLFDGNPWRLMLRSPFAKPAIPELRHEMPLLSFALVLGLSTVALGLGGSRGSGGFLLWAAAAVTLIAPLLFYVSSRNRLPFAALLMVPAGAGLVRLVAAARRAFDRRVATSVAAGLAVSALSLGVPHADLRIAERASALGVRSRVEAARGDLAGAARFARLATERNRKSAPLSFNLGFILDRQGRYEEAEQAYRRALMLDPGHADAAAQLGILLIRDGKSAKAVPILRQALAVRPTHEACWANLVIALADAKGAAEAMAAAREAEGLGIKLASELLESASKAGEGSAGKTKPTVR